MKRMIMFAFVLAAAILVFSCQVNVNTGDDPNGSNNQQTGDVSFTDTPTGYSIRVNNRTTQRLVAFKGELQVDKLLGGIPARESSFGLPKNPALFGQKSEGFALILITEKQYNDNKTNLRSLENTPFTRIFAFYNANGTNESIYEISDRLGGNCSIQIQNLSALDVELRLNGIYGETLGFARNSMLNTTLSVNPADYLIFPVFIKYNAIRDELITVYPKGSTGVAWYTQVELGESTTLLSVDVSKLLEGITYSTGTAWLIIDNQASDTGVQLQKGGVPQLTAMGISTINSGFNRTFQIDMAKVPGTTNKYADTANISAYSVGRTGGLLPIGNYDLEADTIYKVTVTGSANSGTLALSAPVSQGKISLEDFTSTP